MRSHGTWCQGPHGPQHAGHPLAHPRSAQVCACRIASLKPCTRRRFRQESLDTARLPRTIPSLVGAPGLTLSDVLQH